MVNNTSRGEERYWFPGIEAWAGYLPRLHKRYRKHFQARIVDLWLNANSGVDVLVSRRGFVDGDRQPLALSGYWSWKEQAENQQWLSQPNVSNPKGNLLNEREVLGSTGLGWKGARLTHSELDNLLPSFLQGPQKSSIKVSLCAKVSLLNYRRLKMQLWEASSPLETWATRCDTSKVKGNDEA